MVCLTRTSRYLSKRRSWLVPLLPTFILSWLLANQGLLKLDLPDECKTLDVLDVVQGMAKDKVVGVGRGNVEAQDTTKLSVKIL